MRYIYSPTKQIRYSTKTVQWEPATDLATNIPITNERAEVTIPVFEEIYQTSIIISQISVSLTTVYFDLDQADQGKPTSAILLAYRLYRIIHIIRRGKLVLLIRIAGMTKFKLETREIERSAALRLASEAWYKRDRGVNNRQLPPCPTKKSQADKDDRYIRETIIQDIWRIKVFKRTKATSCYRQSNVG